LKRLNFELLRKGANPTLIVLRRPTMSIPGLIVELVLPSDIVIAGRAKKMGN
jgi:hypothetical protein